VAEAVVVLVAAAEVPAGPAAQPECAGHLPRWLDAQGGKADVGAVRATTAVERAAAAEAI
jgi:hypothetical protein